MIVRAIDRKTRQALTFLATIELDLRGVKTLATFQLSCCLRVSGPLTHTWFQTGHRQAVQRTS
jgi:hypothetical protein